MIDLTWALRLYSRLRMRELARQNPRQVQEAQLFKLLAQAKNTRFGQAHHFSSIRTVKDYQTALPLRRYEDFWKEYWEPQFPRVENQTWPGLVPYYCWSSGTTSGKRKFIPYTHDMVRSYNKGGTDLLLHHLAHRPQSRLFGGKSFMLGASTTLTPQCEGVYLGEVSGISARELPFWAKPFFFPPRELTDKTDWIERTQAIAKHAVGQDIRLLGGMPSWLLIFLEQFRESYGKENGEEEGLITRLFPNIELFVHGGVNFEPYRKKYASLLAGSHAEMREIYPASEGFFAVADRGYGEGMRLVLDTGIFYEFVPLEELESPNPTRHWIANVETGINYALLLSTCSGCWSYIIGDTLRFVDTKIPRVLVTGRTSYAMSAFGEHLINEEIEQGVQQGAESIGVDVQDFTVGVELSSQTGEIGRHVYYVEFSRDGFRPEDLKTFREALDKKLQDLNDDYADHRAPGCGVLEPKIIALRQGAFASWMKMKGKLGDQHKVPRVIQDKELFLELERYFQGKDLLVACSVDEKAGHQA